ncbi:myeloid zinc finger 1-like [Diceros bicornis minor]|uniref:myeloid zinc finger 1-like n=1 Tax=Diceros bicornis minor TaxID=77932 RepID=UPI0026E9D4D4|nr:myeloid zinc finger 1-like [Diceros bicornis minor]
MAHLCDSRSRGSTLGHVAILPSLGTGMMSAQTSKALALVPRVLQSTPTLVVGGPGPETPGQRFLGFRYEEAKGPHKALAQLWELCRQWLWPEVRSKEQMLELLGLEQFLGTLLPEIQARVWGQWPGSPEEAAALVEGLRQELAGQGLQVRVGWVGLGLLPPKPGSQPPAGAGAGG